MSRDEIERLRLETEESRPSNLPDCYDECDTCSVLVMRGQRTCVRCMYEAEREMEADWEEGRLDEPSA